MEANSFLMITIFFGVLIFIGYSVYNLIKSPHLSKREKINLSFIIAIAPIFGSCVFYFYDRYAYQANRRTKYSLQNIKY